MCFKTLQVRVWPQIIKTFPKSYILGLRVRVGATGIISLSRSESELYWQGRYCGLRVRVILAGTRQTVARARHLGPRNELFAGAGTASQNHTSSHIDTYKHIS